MVTGTCGHLPSRGVIKSVSYKPCDQVPNLPWWKFSENAFTDFFIKATVILIIKRLKRQARRDILFRVPKPGIIFSNKSQGRPPSSSKLPTKNISPKPWEQLCIDS